MAILKFRKGGIHMKSYVTKFKEENMFCYRCLMNVVKSLSVLKSLQEINIDINTQKIKVVYGDKNISKEDIKNIVKESILRGKIVRLAK